MSKIIATVISKLFDLYKMAISPYMPGQCRFTPTCSDYSAEAITLYGLRRGFMLTMWRLLRCNPFTAGGYDPPSTPASTPVFHMSSQEHENSHSH